MIDILGVLNDIQIIFKKDTRDLMDQALGVGTLDAEDMVVFRGVNHDVHQLSMICLRYQPLFESSSQANGWLKYLGQISTQPDVWLASGTSVIFTHEGLFAFFVNF